MNKQTYLQELERELTAAGIADIPEHLAYFEELFSDMLEDGLSEEEITARLGDPRRLAETILLEEKGEKLPEKDREESVRASRNDRPAETEGKDYEKSVQTPFASLNKLLKNLTGYFGNSAESASVHVTELPGEGLYGLDIDWDMGDVEICVGEEEKILLKETRSANTPPAEYLCKDGVLSVRCRKEGPYLGRGKDLTLVLPRTLAQTLATCRIRTVAGDMKLEDLSCGTVQIKSVSGDLRTSGLRSQSVLISSVSGDMELDLETTQMTVNTVSGDIAFRGKAGQVSLATKSGDAELVFETCPDKTEIQTVSGDLELVLPEDSRIRFLAKTVSGDVSRSGIREDDSAPSLVSVRSVSGDISVRTE